MHESAKVGRYLTLKARDSSPLESTVVHIRGPRVEERDLLELIDSPVVEQLVELVLVLSSVDCCVFPVNVNQ